MNLHYAAMTLADIDQVVAAERQLHPSPWTRGNFADALAAGYDAQLALHADGQLMGYGVVMLAVDEAELLKLSVLTCFQRQGVGTTLCHHLMTRAKARRAVRMMLEVRAGNIAGQALYGHLGFSEIGRRRGYYAAGQQREDAIVMAINL